VYAGKDPLTGRELRFQKTRGTRVEAQIELGKLLALAWEGRQPDSDVTVAELLDGYVPVAGWNVSTEAISGRSLIVSQFGGHLGDLRTTRPRPSSATLQVSPASHRQEAQVTA
jgi:hypothetical protein